METGFRDSVEAGNTQCHAQGHCLLVPMWSKSKHGIKRAAMSHVTAIGWAQVVADIQMYLNLLLLTLLALVYV